MSQGQTSWTFEDSSLGRSFLWSAAITALPVASGFFVSWIIARWAGAEVMGAVSLVMAYATAVLIVGKFGLDLAASQLASEYGVRSPGTLRRLFVAAMAMRAAFTLPVAVASLSLARPIAGLLGDVSLEAPVRVGALIVVCTSLFEFNESFLVGLNRLSATYRIRAAHLLLRGVFTLGIVVSGVGAVAVLGGYCAAWLLAIAAGFVLLARYLPAVTPGSEPVDVGRIFRLSATLAVSSASVTLFSYIDRLMLGHFTGVEEVGQYAVARNIVEVSLFPGFAIAMMLRPALASRYSTQRIADCARVIRHSIRFCWVSGVLFATVFAVLGRDLVVYAFSEEFRPAGELMLLFVGVVLLRSVGAIVLPAMMAAGRTRSYAYLTLLSAVLNVILNLILIPSYRSQGAIVATMASYGVLWVFAMRDVGSRYGVRLSWPALATAFRTILAGALAGLAVAWCLDRSPAFPGGAVVWAAALTGLYIVLVYALRVATFGDVADLLTNLRKQKG
jgi:O-antigen/teichoic acid export membrane protein